MVTYLFLGILYLVLLISCFSFFFLHSSVTVECLFCISFPVKSFSISYVSFYSNFKSRNSNIHFKLVRSSASVSQKPLGPSCMCSLCLLRHPPELFDIHFFSSFPVPVLHCNHCCACMCLLESQWDSNSEEDIRDCLYGYIQACIFNYKDPVGQTTNCVLMSGKCCWHWNGFINTNNHSLLTSFSL